MRKIGMAGAALALLLFACRKADQKGPEPAVVLPDSALRISRIDKRDLTDYRIDFAIDKTEPGTFRNVVLQWSSDPRFAQNHDSLLLTDATDVSYYGSEPVTGLRQATRYYVRLRLRYNDRLYYSPVRTLDTDSLRVTYEGHTSGIITIRRGAQFQLLGTNFAATNAPSPDTRVFLNELPCIVPNDYGNRIFFNVPATIAPGRYRLRLERKGLTAFVRDSFEVLRGNWETLSNPPVFPVNTSAQAHGLFDFGTCITPTAGYLVGGALFNGLNTGNPLDANYSGLLYRFDLQSRQWTALNPTNRRYIDRNVLTTHYQNSIYVFSGVESHPVSGVRYNLPTLKRYDIGANTWFDGDSLPSRRRANTMGFRYQNDFYIGGGVNLDSLSACCAEPLPSRRFWKYKLDTRQWSAVADFPGSYHPNATCFTLGNKAYAFLGAIPLGDPQISTTYRQEFWEYDPAANSWRQLPLPATGGPRPGEKYSILTHNGKAYFLTSQRRAIGAGSYYYAVEPTFLEWEPQGNTFLPFASPMEIGIFHPLGQAGNQFFLYEGPTGYIQTIPNRVRVFTVE